jgi:hypothetical protein
MKINDIRDFRMSHNLKNEASSANPEVRGRPAVAATANVHRSALIRAGSSQYPAELYHFLSTNDSPSSVAAAAATAKICYMRFFNNTAF